MQQTRPAPNPLLPWLTFAAILGTFAVNVWSNLAPLNGQTIGDISNTLFADVLVIPANYAFAIWGLIYLGLLGFGIYQLLPNQRSSLNLQPVRVWLILACVAQAVWVFCFLSRQFWLSVIVMLGILLPLIGIYRQLVPQPTLTRAERWLVRVPFGIYLGWISVATIVNVALALYSQGWNGGSLAAIWTVAMMIIAAAIATTLTARYREVAYPLVIVWALLAIAVRQAAVPLVAVTAGILALGLAAWVGVKTLALRPARSS